MKAVLYRMEDMMTFPVVENYTITIDPRMPGMGNHSSPNNEDLTYQAAQKRYEGKLSLTMTGYWKINMKLLDENGEVLKGEDVTEDNPSSSLISKLNSKSRDILSNLIKTVAMRSLFFIFAA